MSGDRPPPDDSWERDARLATDKWNAFDAIYDVHHKETDRAWISGTELLDRWEMEPEELARNAPGWLPVHLWSKQAGEMVVVNKQIPLLLESLRYPLCPPNATTKLPPGQSFRSPLFAWPEWWWFRKEDVEFCEKVKQELRERVRPLTTEWETVEEVQQCWNNIPVTTLEEQVIKKGLRAYFLSAKKGIIQADETFLTRSLGFGIPRNIHQCMFKQSEREAHEKKFFKKKRSIQGKAKSNEDRVTRCLENLCQKHPDWTLGQYTEEIHIKLDKQLCNNMGKKGIRKIVSKRLNPERKPGRRTTRKSLVK